MRRLISIAGAAFCLVALTVAGMHFRRETQRKEVLDRLAYRFQFDVRRPEIARTLRYAPSADWAAEIVADGVLRDAVEHVNLLRAKPEVREAWVTAAQRIDEELLASQSALLDAIEHRAGWPFYQTLLGQTVFMEQSRRLDRELITHSARWALPLLNGARGTPATRGVWSSIAAAYLRTWPVLASTLEPTANEVFSHAFADTDFVRAAFGDTATLIGVERAMAYLPRKPFAYRSAFNHFASSGDIPHAWLMHSLWEQAEIRSRIDDLAEIERTVENGDASTYTRSLCEQWVSGHSVWQFDSRLAHNQTVRLLEICPAVARGGWTGDPFGEVIRYVMSRGDIERLSPSVLKHLSSFPDAPSFIEAEARLAAGDLAGAERLATTGDTFTASWIPYALRLARYYTERGSRVEAEKALSRVPVGLLKGQQLAVVRGQAFDVDVATTSSCGRAVDLSVPGVSRIVTVNVVTEEPAIVDVEVDHARARSIVVSGSGSTPLPLDGWRDKTITVRAITGDKPACADVASSP
jgi:hypothetical protein